MARGGVPSPPVVLGEVRAGIERGWPAGLTLLTGDDAYHMDLAQRALLAALAADGDGGELGLTVYDDDSGAGVGEVVAAARSVGMFSPRRVVLVRGVLALERGDAAALEEYARAPPAASFLLVRAPALDRRKKLHLALSKLGRTLVFDASGLTGPALGREIQAMATARGLALDRAAVGLLVDLCGGDFLRLSGELDKLAVFAGDGRIDARAVREVAAGSGTFSGWEVGNALVARDRATALAGVRRALASGVEPLPLLGGIAWKVHELLARGTQRYSAAELLRFPSLLFEADRTLKSSALDPFSVLERLLDRLTGPLPAAERAAPSAADRRRP